MPARGQRKRMKGWRKPPGAVCVTRPGRWGNPWEVATHPETGSYYAVRHRPRTDRPRYRGPWHATPREAAGRAVRLYRRLLTLYRVDLSALRGKYLLCYCDSGSPCHADVLAELATT